MTLRTIWSNFFLHDARHDRKSTRPTKSRSIDGPSVLAVANPR